MDEARFRWVKVADYESEIPFGDNRLAEVEADGRKICLGKHNDALFAFAPKCPHASGPLARGFIDALGNVVCPLHRYKFCMKNGRNVSGAIAIRQCRRRSGRQRFPGRDGSLGLVLTLEQRRPVTAALEICARRHPDRRHSRPGQKSVHGIVPAEVN